MSSNSNSNHLHKSSSSPIKDESQISPRPEIHPEIHEDNDDLPVGRILSRREILAIFGGSAAIFAGAKIANAQSAQNLYLPWVRSTNENVDDDSDDDSDDGDDDGTTIVPTCIARPEVTEGPYFVDERLNRADIRSDPTTGVVKDGTLLTLTFNVSQITNNSCAVFAGAIVDIWHCDALGIYSDVSDPGFNTAGQKFLRGYLVTDANGSATFTTIYPGWYSSRAVHIHFKIRSSFDSTAYEFTSQLFFDEDLTDVVYSQQPYSTKGRRDTFNSNDNIYRDELLLSTTEDGDGYAATFNVGLELS